MWPAGRRARLQAPPLLQIQPYMRAHGVPEHAGVQGQRRTGFSELRAGVGLQDWMIMIEPSCNTPIRANFPALTASSSDYAGARGRSSLMSR